VHPEYSFESHFFSTHGHCLHYIDEGEGPVIVLVHGNPTWSFYYRNLIKLLSKRYRVISLDNIGCGLSDKPQAYDYCLENHIQNLTALLGDLNVTKCSLIVHDWGGAIGIGYAVRHIKNIEKIVILNTAAFRSKRIPFRIQICRWPVLGELLVRGLNGFAWPATFMAVTKPMDRSVKKMYLFPYSSWKNRIAVYNFVKDIPLTPSHPSYSTLVGIEQGLSLIQQKNIPMLILWGGKDFCFTEHFFFEWKERFPEAESHFFKNGGHYILEDHFTEIQPILSSFFQNN
jgi:pimeloyl-ACP methyl ester carboxylesterase